MVEDLSRLFPCLFAEPASHSDGIRVGASRCTTNLHSKGGVPWVGRRVRRRRRKVKPRTRSWPYISNPITMSSKIGSLIARKLHMASDLLSSSSYRGSHSFHYARAISFLNPHYFSLQPRVLMREHVFFNSIFISLKTYFFHNFIVILL